MSPSVSAVLIYLAGKVAANAMPQVNPVDRVSTLGLSAALMALAAESWDSAAHHLVMENRAIRALLVQGGALAGADAELATLTEDDFRLSVLGAENAKLRAALIRLQIAAEGQDEALNAAIWVELRASTDRRSTQNFSG